MGVLRTGIDDDDEEVRIDDNQDCIEEISSDDFKATKKTSISGTMMTTAASYDGRNVYCVSGNVASSLFSLAWAQTVQNRSSSLDGVKGEIRPVDGRRDSNVGSEVDPLVVESDEEEDGGELEDGEIDFDMAVNKEEGGENEGGLRDDFEIELDDGELEEEEVDWIRQMIERVTPTETEKSFRLVCNLLSLSLERLGKVEQYRCLPMKDALVGQAFSAIQCVCTVFNSMSSGLKEQNKAAMARLLSNVLSVNPLFFSPEQKKEVEAVMVSVSNLAIEQTTPASEKQEELPVTEKPILSGSIPLPANTDHILVSPEKIYPGQSIDPADKEISRNSTSGARVNLDSLSDHHNDNGEKTLPSIGHKSVTPQTSPVVGVVCTSDSTVVGMGNELENVVFHPYVEKAIRAVSSYQKKFSRVLFSPGDRLPSPTPSEGSKNEEAAEAGPEVSSSCTLENINNAHPSVMPNVLARPVVPLPLNTCSSFVPGVIQSSNARLDASFSNPIFPASLEYTNSNIKNGTLPVLPTFGSNSETVPELLSLKMPRTAVPGAVGPALKKQRTGPETTQVLSDKKDRQTLPRSQGVENGGLFSHRTGNPTARVKPRCTHASVQNGSSGVEQSATTDALPEHTSASLNRLECALPEQSNGIWRATEHLSDRYDDLQKAVIQRERARRIEEQNKMFDARKLCLVLDLDHTLLNSAKFSDIDPVHDEILRKKEDQDRKQPKRHLFRLPHMGMWTKLRPGIWTFLEKASKMYELHLYTMGNKVYANEMARILDPKGVLFAGRVISRGDDGDPFDGEERALKCKDLDGVLGMESAVVIIDDTAAVWPHNQPNLMVVERYIYFPCSARQFGFPGSSYLEVDSDEKPEGGLLASSLTVIKKIHCKFFSHECLDRVDVRKILASEKRKILAGCRILFSHVIPVGDPTPHLHPLWQTAEQFGAVCTTQIDEQVTHVVTVCLGTEKVGWALSTGRHVVHTGWVEASAYRYQRANEKDFSLKHRKMFNPSGLN